MGHPYNQTQHVEIKNLSAQRFVGTDIQKNLFYGRDDYDFDFIYTGLAQRVYNDYATQEFELFTSGDFVRLYTGEFGFRAEHTGIIRGESIDYPAMSIVHYGVQDRFPYHYPELAYGTSGNFSPSDLDVGYERFKWRESEIIRIDWDEPYIGGSVPSSGKMLGLKWTIGPTAGFALETGDLFKGRIRHDLDDLPEEIATTMQYTFITGRYDGGLS